jgi:hypothetical protein
LSCNAFCDIRRFLVDSNPAGTYGGGVESDTFLM